MSDLEGIGEAATGAMLARTAEPRAGEAGAKADGHTRERDCLNCGARLAGDYCHACGQKAHVHRTLAAFWHDLLHSVIHFDGKLWRTLPLLAWQPGELTRRYIHGERARFVSPIALFLFTVFLMFAIFSTPRPDRRLRQREPRGAQHRLLLIHRRKSASSKPTAAIAEPADRPPQSTVKSSLDDCSRTRS